MQEVTALFLLAQLLLSVLSILRFMALVEAPPLPCQLAPQGHSPWLSVTSPHGYPHSQPIGSSASWEWAQVYVPSLPKKPETWPTVLFTSYRGSITFRCQAVLPFSIPVKNLPPHSSILDQKVLWPQESHPKSRPSKELVYLYS